MLTEKRTKLSTHYHWQLLYFATEKVLTPPKDKSNKVEKLIRREYKGGLHKTAQKKILNHVSPCQNPLLWISHNFCWLHSKLCLLFLNLQWSCQICYVMANELAKHIQLLYTIMLLMLLGIASPWLVKWFIILQFANVWVRAEIRKFVKFTSVRSLQVHCLLPNKFAKFPCKFRNNK